MNIREGPAFRRFRITAGKCKHGRDDHQTCHNGNGRIKDLYILCRVPQWKYPFSYKNRM